MSQNGFRVFLKMILVVWVKLIIENLFLGISVFLHRITCSESLYKIPNEISENLWTPLCVKNGFSFITINGMAIKVLLSKQAVLYFIRHSSRSDSLFVLLKFISYNSCNEPHLLKVSRYEKKCQAVTSPK